MSILPELEAAHKLLSNISSIHKGTLESMKECEDEENDIRHAYELGSLKYKDRAKLATQLAQILQERRKFKDALEIIEPLYELMQSPEGVAFMKKLQPVLGETRKIKRGQVNRIYFYRTETVKNTLQIEAPVSNGRGYLQISH